MRHSKATKEKVRILRGKGYSLNQIKLHTRVPVTTIRTWISDISLTNEQKFVLNSRALLALQEGSKKARETYKIARQQLIKNLYTNGISNIGEISARELFIAGVALYWAEGFKNIHERRLGFCNSDPSMIRFYVRWLEKSLNVKRSNLIARVTLNKSYEGKVQKIEHYWSKTTGIPLSQFTKPFFQNSIWKKQYNTDTYYGVLRIHVKDSLELLLKMKGWIEGLKRNMAG